MQVLFYGKEKVYTKIAKSPKTKEYKCQVLKKSSVVEQLSREEFTVVFIDMDFNEGKAKSLNTSLADNPGVKRVILFSKMDKKSLKRHQSSPESADAYLNKPLKEADILEMIEDFKEFDHEIVEVGDKTDRLENLTFVSFDAREVLKTKGSGNTEIKSSTAINIPVQEILENDKAKEEAEEKPKKAKKAKEPVEEEVVDIEDDLEIEIEDEVEETPKADDSEAFGQEFEIPSPDSMELESPLEASEPADTSEQFNAGEFEIEDGEPEEFQLEGNQVEGADGDIGEVSSIEGLEEKNVAAGEPENVESLVELESTPTAEASDFEEGSEIDISEQATATAAASLEDMESELKIQREEESVDEDELEFGAGDPSSTDVEADSMESSKISQAVNDLLSSDEGSTLAENTKEILASFEGSESPVADENNSKVQQKFDQVFGEEEEDVLDILEEQDVEEDDQPSSVNIEFSDEDLEPVEEYTDVSEILSTSEDDEDDSSENILSDDSEVDIAAAASETEADVLEVVEEEDDEVNILDDEPVDLLEESSAQIAVSADPSQEEQSILEEEMEFGESSEDEVEAALNTQNDLSMETESKEKTYPSFSAEAFSIDEELSKTNIRKTEDTGTPATVINQAALDELKPEETDIPAPEPTVRKEELTFGEGTADVLTFNDGKEHTQDDHDKTIVAHDSVGDQTIANDDDSQVGFSATQLLEGVDLTTLIPSENSARDPQEETAVTQLMDGDLPANTSTDLDISAPTSPTQEMDEDATREIDATQLLDSSAPADIAVNLDTNPSSNLQIDPSPDPTFLAQVDDLQDGEEGILPSGEDTEYPDMDGDDELEDDIEPVATIPESELPKSTLVTASKEELIRSAATIRHLRDDRENLLSQISILERDKMRLQQEGTSMRAELDEAKIELSIMKKRYAEQNEDLKYQLNLSEEKRVLLEEKIKHYQKEFERLNQNVRVDFNKIRQRERELESQLELVIHDSEAQVRSRDEKILALKRKIDSLEFNMENMTIQEVKSRDDKIKLEDRLTKVVKTLRDSIQKLEDDVTFDDSDKKQVKKVAKKVKRKEN